MAGIAILFALAGGGHVGVTVPALDPPTIDGTMSPGEWDHASRETFSDGSELLMLHHEGFLYLGIRADTEDMIVANIFVDHGDEIAILHSSAALGTAVYRKSADDWEQTRGFDWSCRRTDDSDAARAERAAFLREENWVAGNARMGTPQELEYRIALPGDTLRLAAIYMKVSEPNVKIPWPSDLNDDCVRPTPGGMPARLDFSPQRWATIELRHKSS
jgi:hypothetical protein